MPVACVSAVGANVAGLLQSEQLQSSRAWTLKLFPEKLQLVVCGFLPPPFFSLSALETFSRLETMVRCRMSKHPTTFFLCFSVWPRAEICFCTVIWVGGASFCLLARGIFPCCFVFLCSLLSVILSYAMLILCWATAVTSLLNLYFGGIKVIFSYLLLVPISLCARGMV